MILTLDWGIIKSNGGVKIDVKDADIDFKKSQNIHLKFVKQQFLLSLLRKLDYDMNT